MRIVNSTRQPCRAVFEALGFLKLGLPQNRTFVRPKLHLYCNMASLKVLVIEEAPYPSYYKISF